jgi:hypothetical protein
MIGPLNFFTPHLDIIEADLFMTAPFLGNYHFLSPWIFQFNKANSIASSILDVSGHGAPSRKDCKC